MTNNHALSISMKLLCSVAPGDSLAHSALAELIDHIFHKIMPDHGFTYREAQHELSAHILDSICRRGVCLAEGEVGSGKTLAYLMAAALAKRGRVNDFWLRGSYPDQSYADSAYMPVVICTSSIALQKALAEDYIPQLSNILLRENVTNSPLTSVIRKGREHYLCDHRLWTYYSDADTAAKKILNPLTLPGASIDLADAEHLTPYIKRMIGVPGRCSDDCPHRKHCRYLRHIRDAQANRCDFQITNHNYFLADALRRKAGLSPLLPHYQAVIFDEGHKLSGAARQMYGAELDGTAIPEITGLIRNTDFRGDAGPEIWRKTKKLHGQNKRLFKLLRTQSSGCEAMRATVDFNGDAVRYLQNIHSISIELIAMLEAAEAISRHHGRRDRALRELEALRDHAAVFSGSNDMIRWLEKNRDEAGVKLCAIPKNLDELLYTDLWSHNIPFIITSGTLSAAGDFGRIKRTLGLDKLPSRRLTEIRKQSPFNYCENTMIYISDRIPFPDNGSERYIAAVADETERMIRACHGHAAVLFTSYKVMDMVWTRLVTRRLPFPMFRLGRGSESTISAFKASRGGVLFASGSFWEGIDVPGDALSLLIIVRLPFAVPDPVGDYEQSRYGGICDYKNAVLIPDMLIRLLQGYGRLLRLETDTGVAAFLDCRVLDPLRDTVLGALPRCRVTEDLDEVASFLREKKDDTYFMPISG